MVIPGRLLKSVRELRYCQMYPYQQDPAGRLIMESSIHCHLVYPSLLFGQLANELHVLP